MRFIKLQAVIVLIFLLISGNSCYSSELRYDYDLLAQENTQIPQNQTIFVNEDGAEVHIIYENNILFIKVAATPPETTGKLRSEVSKLLLPHLMTPVQKASIIWQKDEFSFGIMASVAGVYIDDYLNRKIRAKKLLNYLNIQTIDPTPVHKNNVSKSEVDPVSQELSQKAAMLRETADIYRFNGFLDSAVRIYNQALELNPNDTVALFRLAEIYNIQGDYQQAEEYYIKVLSIDPDFKSADDSLYELRQHEQSENKLPEE